MVYVNVIDVTKRASLLFVVFISLRTDSYDLTMINQYRRLQL